MLTVESVSKRFPRGNYGVRDLSLSLDSGVLGLLGPNGAGKTTLMQMIATITRPTAGKITFDGHDIAARPDALRERLGYLPQDFGVYDNLTALEFLSYFAALKGVTSRARVMEMLEAVNLHAVAKRALGSFSGGMKQRLGIAQALINNPDLVIVDEPTAGLDPEERVRFRNVLSELGFGKLVILSTHIVSDIESVATQIAIMKEGRLIVLGAPEELLRAAEGAVWEWVMPSDEFERRRGELRISSAVRRPDGVHARVVSPEAPWPGARGAEADLEDAFLYVMNFGSGAPAGNRVPA
ncbi:MAG: ABC transporter ATP-binding protein [Thermoanaerobaculia bacterium]